MRGWKNQIGIGRTSNGWNTAGKIHLFLTFWCKQQEKFTQGWRLFG